MCWLRVWVVISYAWVVCVYVYSEYSVCTIRMCVWYICLIRLYIQVVFVCMLKMFVFGKRECVVNMCGCSMSVWLFLVGVMNVRMRCT